MGKHGKTSLCVQHSLVHVWFQCLYAVQIPFSSFVLTSGGEAATAQVTMGKNKVRTVGISMLGGNAKISGKYELGIDYIGAVVNVRCLRLGLDLVPYPLNECIISGIAGGRR